MNGEKMSDDGYMLEMCSSKASWQVIPNGIDEIDLESVGKRIIEAGWKLRIETRFCWIFEGEAKLTLYPSGKLLIKTDTDEMAKNIAIRHVNEWVGVD